MDQKSTFWLNFSTPNIFRITQDGISIMEMDLEKPMWQTMFYYIQQYSKSKHNVRI